MISLRHLLGWLLGLVALGFSVVTLLSLISMLSAQSGRHMDEAVPCCAPYLASLLWNLFLLTIFVLQHSAMSSDAWKMMLSRFGISDFLHRPLYVICSCAVLHLILYHMVSLPGPSLWYFDVNEYPTLSLTVFILHCVMWFVICAGAFAADPMEFIGLKQLYVADAEQKQQVPPVGDLIHSRHVGVLAFIVILWVHVVMSVERFLLAMVWTLYLLFGNRSFSASVYIVRAEHKND